MHFHDHCDPWIPLKIFPPITTFWKRWMMAPQNRPQVTPFKHTPPKGRWRRQALARFRFHATLLRGFTVPAGGTVVNSCPVLPRVLQGKFPWKSTNKHVKKCWFLEWKNDKPIPLTMVVGLPGILAMLRWACYISDFPSQNWLLNLPNWYTRLQMIAAHHIYVAL